MTSTDTLSTAATVYKTLTMNTGSTEEALVVIDVVRALLIMDSLNKSTEASQYGHGV